MKDSIIDGWKSDAMYIYIYADYYQVGFIDGL